MDETLPYLRENGADLEESITDSKIGHDEQDLNFFQSTNIFNTQVSMILDKANFINKALSVDHFLISPTPFDSETSVSDFTSSLLQNLFDS